MFSKFFLNYAKVKKSIYNELSSAKKQDAFNVISSTYSNRFIETIEKLLKIQTQKKFYIKFRKFIEFKKASEVFASNYKLKDTLNSELTKLANNQDSLKTTDYNNYNENVEHYYLEKLANEKRVIIFEKLVCKHGFLFTPTICLAKSFLLDY
jgi:hypothetical protein